MATSLIMQVTLLTLLFSGSLSARELPPPAYQIAARQADIPSAVLYAVTLQESGIRLRGKLIPWPWTLNVAGIPERYSNRIEACVGLQRALQRVPAKRVDVGLGQINVGYQSQHFDHPCELLNPYRNLKIAANLLREQHVPGENWVIAIGRYHRPAGGAPAERYRRSVQKHLVRVIGNGADASLTLTKVSTP